MEVLKFLMANAASGGSVLACMGNEIECFVLYKDYYI